MFSSDSYQHVPIMLHECAEYLNIAQVSRHIDATLGLGGHAAFFLEQNPTLYIVGIDQDPFAQAIATQRLASFQERFSLVSSNFETIQNLKDFKPQSILFDVGVSSLQFDMPERGFSFRFEAPLDMRMNPNTLLTAATIVNEYSEEQLVHILQTYGEEPEAKKIAAAIVLQRKKTPITTTTQLLECIVSAKSSFFSRHKNAGGHPASLSFQALRIVVNRELDVLETALHGAISILEPKGRIAVLTFHSLEDRIVKTVFSSYFQKEKRQKYSSVSSVQEKIVLIPVCKKPLLPSAQEIAFNPRARSAKLRVVEKI